MLEVSDAQVISFLAHAERLTVDEWLEILRRVRELRTQRLPAIRRLRDMIALNAPTAVGMLANERIAAITRTLGQELRQQDEEAVGVVRFWTAVVSQLTAAAYAIERSDELGAADLAQLYASFESCISFRLLA